MSCKHEKIKSVNCNLFCMDCGATLPADFFTKQAEKPKADVKADNSPAANVTGAESAENAVSGDGVPVLCEGVPTIPYAEPAEVKQEAPAEIPDKTEQKKERATRQPKKEKGGTK